MVQGSVIIFCFVKKINLWFSLGIDQIPIDLKKEKAKKFWQPVPPYNGFGSEEDSLGSVYSLQPKPPRKDINKMFTVIFFVKKLSLIQK